MIGFFRRAVRVLALHPTPLRGRHGCVCRPRLSNVLLAEDEVAIVSEAAVWDQGLTRQRRHNNTPVNSIGILMLQDEITEVAAHGLTRALVPVEPVLAACLAVRTAPLLRHDAYVATHLHSIGSIAAAIDLDDILFNVVEQPTPALRLVLATLDLA